MFSQSACRTDCLGPGTTQDSFVLLGHPLIKLGDSGPKSMQGIDHPSTFNDIFMVA